MAIVDRILPLCDLLLGAAYADLEVRDPERDEIRGLLEDLAGELPTEVELRIASFDPKKFDLAATARAFHADSDDDRKKLLVLASAVIEADDEIDFAEDDYLRDLAKALKLPASALAGLTVEVESVEPAELKQTFQKVRKGPPPPPAKAGASVDVDLD